MNAVGGATERLLSELAEHISLLGMPGLGQLCCFY